MITPIDELVVVLRAEGTSLVTEVKEANNQFIRLGQTSVQASRQLRMVSDGNAAVAASFKDVQAQWEKVNALEAKGNTQAAMWARGKAQNLQVIANSHRDLTRSLQKMEADEQGGGVLRSSEASNKTKAEINARTLAFRRDYDVRVGLEERYYSLTASNREQELRRIGEFYGKMRLQYAGNQQMLAQIDKTQNAETMAVMGGGEGGGLSKRLARRFFKMAAADTVGMISPQLGEATAFGMMASMSGASLGTAVGVGAGIAVLTTLKDGYQETKKIAKELEEIQKEHTKSLEEAAHWAEQLASPKTTEAGGKFAARGYSLTEYGSQQWEKFKENIESGPIPHVVDPYTARLAARKKTIQLEDYQRATRQARVLMEGNELEIRATQARDIEMSSESLGATRIGGWVDSGDKRLAQLGLRQQSEASARRFEQEGRMRELAVRAKLTAKPSEVWSDDQIALQERVYDSQIDRANKAMAMAHKKGMSRLDQLEVWRNSGGDDAMELKKKIDAQKAYNQLQKDTRQEKDTQARVNKDAKAKDDLDTQILKDQIERENAAKLHELDSQNTQYDIRLNQRGVERERQLLAKQQRDKLYGFDLAHTRGGNLILDDQARAERAKMVQGFQGESDVFEQTQQEAHDEKLRNLDRQYEVLTGVRSQKSADEANLRDSLQKEYGFGDEAAKKIDEIVEATLRLKDAQEQLAHTQAMEGLALQIDVVQGKMTSFDAEIQQYMNVNGDKMWTDMDSFLQGFEVIQQKHRLSQAEFAKQQLDELDPKRAFKRYADEVNSNPFMTDAQKDKAISHRAKQMADNPNVGQFVNLGERWNQIQQAILAPKDDIEQAQLDELKAIADESKKVKRVACTLP